MPQDLLPALYLLSFHPSVATQESVWGVAQHRRPQECGRRQTRQGFDQIDPRDHDCRPHRADPATNARLRAGIDKALSSNMSKDTIERAIKRGSGAEGADHMQELRYEGYGPSGVALIIDAMTDNAQRTVADVATPLAKHGATLAPAVRSRSSSTASANWTLTRPAARTSCSTLRSTPAPMTCRPDPDKARYRPLRNRKPLKNALIAAGFVPLLWRCARKIASWSAPSRQTLRDLIDWLKASTMYRRFITTRRSLAEPSTANYRESRGSIGRGGCRSARIRVPARRSEIMIGSG